MSRACGECTACCTSLAVHELRKRAFKKCEHVCATGCGIYAERPGGCRTFRCLWLGTEGEDTSALVRDEERPDKSGLVITFVGDQMDFDSFFRRYKYPPLQVFEAWPGALDSYRGQKLLNRLRRRAIIVAAPFDSLDRRMYAPDGYDAAAIETLRGHALRNAKREDEALKAGLLPVDAE